MKLFQKKNEKQTKKEIVRDLKHMSLSHAILWIVTLLFVVIIMYIEDEAIIRAVAFSFFGISALILSVFYAMIGILTKNNLIRAKNQIDVLERLEND